RAVGSAGPATDVVAVHLGHDVPPGPELRRRLAAAGARAVPDGTTLTGGGDGGGPRGPRRTRGVGGARPGECAEAGGRVGGGRGAVGEVRGGRAAAGVLPRRAVRRHGRYARRGHRVGGPGGRAPGAAAGVLADDGDLRPRAVAGAGRTGAADRLSVAVADG